MKTNNEINFHQKLKDKKSINIQEELSRFVNEDFKKIVMLDKNEIAKKIQDLVSKLLVDFANLWRINIKNNHSQYIEICDGFEGLITKALYNKIFCSTRKEKEEDYQFEKLVRKFHFITPKHLDIDESIIDNVYIDVAINKLSMINQFKPPKDKGVILINFCNILTSMITENANKNHTKIAGADEVFPMVVYVILKGNVKKLKSNLRYIQLFRHETRMESQEEYYFTTINSAMEFIENSNYNKLNIKEIEFNSSCDQMDKIELERMKTSIVVSKRNNDENYLLYHLGVKQEDSSYIELADLNNNILLNTESVISKATYNAKGTGLINVDLEKLYKEYFNCIEFKEFSIAKIEKLYNDFRIFLKLIDSFKQNYYKAKDNLL